MAIPFTTPVITLEITDECPLSCIYCYRAGHSRTGTPLPFAAQVALLDSLSKAVSARTVQIAGGEPLASPHLFDWIERIRTMGLTPTLLTDGALITAETAERLKAAGIAMVQPTLLAAAEAPHDRLKGGPTFRRTVEGITALVALDIPVSLAFVVTRLSADFFRDVVELAFALGIKTVALSRYTASGDQATDETLTPTPAQLRACLETAQWANEKLSMKVRVAISIPHCLAEGLNLPQVPLGHCALASDTPGLTMDSRGDLRACAVSTEILGHLPAQPLEVILERAKSYFESRRALPPICQRCPRVSACRGGCRESAFSTGGPASPDPLLPTDA